MLNQATIERQDGVYRVNGTTFPNKGFSTILNRTIGQLPVSGGEITLQNGIHDVEKPIEIDRPIYLHGIGAGHTTKKMNMTILAATKDLKGPVLKITGENAYGTDMDKELMGKMHGTRLSDLAIVGQKEGQQTDCILIDNAEGANISNMFLQRLAVDGAGRHGINIKGAEKHHQLRDLWIAHCESDALRITDGYRYWITNCYGYRSRNGIRVTEDTNNVIIRTPHCRWNQKAGISVDSIRFQILGGRSIQNDELGIVAGGQNGVISSVTSINNGSYDVRVGRNDKKVSGIRIYGCHLGAGPLPQFPDTNSSQIPNYPEIFKRKVKTEGWKTAVNDGLDYFLQGVVNKFAQERHSLEPSGILIKRGARDTYVIWNHISGISTRIIDNGTRTLINGLGQNSGNPEVTGEWKDAGFEGVGVWDNEKQNYYKYIRGEWRCLLS